ncbi:MAG: cytochrome c oxidase assembly protein [Actinomycetota bacterium]|nr:cytochrome c oxidase assembly protein [Actinomycetota bacterium]
MLLAGVTAATPWVWVPHPDVWFLVAGLGGGYLWALRTLGPRLGPPGGTAATRGQKSAFLFGLTALWIGADWPMHELSEGFLYSAHMIQHMLFTFIAPPLLLLGAPKWMLRAILSPPRVLATVQRLSRPFTALLLFNGLIALTHWPALVNASLRSEPLHFAVHTALFSAALLMWTPVIGPLPELPRLSDPAKLLYLFGQSILPTVPASFLTFAQSPIYTFYETVPRLWGLAVLTDQLLAGLIMKIGGGLLLWSIMAVIFFRWHARELADRPDEITWDDFEIELKSAGLRK